MKPTSRKIHHSLFLAGIILKTLIGIGEAVFGLAFAFLNYDTLHRIVLKFVGEELTENPLDFIWAHVLQGLHGFFATPQSVWAFIFLSHGIVKIFLLTGLWRNKTWAYPASVIAFTFFIIYQFYQLFFTPSDILWLITIIDIAVVLLIINEYRHRKNIVLVV